MRAQITVVFLAILLAGCGDGATYSEGGGDSWRNLTPVPNPNPDAESQPTRRHPYGMAMSPDGDTVLVTMRGSEIEPGSEIAFVSASLGQVSERVTVGDRPIAVKVRPSGDFAVVLSQFSPYAAVIDVSGRSLAGKIEVGYYGEDLIFSSDGSTMFVTNRAQDSVQKWDVGRVGDSLKATLVAETPAGTNPAAITLSADGSKVYVADHRALAVRVYSTSSLAEITVIPFNAQVLGLATMGSWVIATTMNDTNGLPCEDDGDYIGTQGDGIMPIVTDSTCGRGFADIQNEIAFIDTSSDQIAIRYTSDTADTSEADREGDYPLELMRVTGALPFGIAVASDTRAFISMGASDEVVEISLDGQSPPGMLTANRWPTGFTPRGIVATPDGSTVFTANMLGESISVIDTTGDRNLENIVGNNSPAFPATSAEIGEMYFHSSKFSTDGDQSCTHCHFNSESDNKGWGVEVVRAFGRRSTMMVRNLAMTQPLLIEGVFDEKDFNLEMAGMAFRPDFHDSSYVLQVERREQFFVDQTRQLINQEIGFQDMIGHVASYLMDESRLLPSPFPKDTPEVERGRAIFFRPDVGCAACHPEPNFASEELFSGITTLGRYDLPRRDLDPDTSVKFIEYAQDGFFNSNSLRGLWDRKGSFFHDGRARTVRETIMTPQHSCLEPGELAFNEFNGQVDTNGGISHLTCTQIDELVEFMMTID
ncbi:MAG: hypothetical protein GY811_11615 [Myxococcales bacterium]|nr:hypothetical protein [Myxococcales bacterium]